MLQDLDQTLQALLELHLPSGAGGRTYSITFDAPDSQQANAAGINLFLYDVRENLELRSTISGFERQSDGTALRKRAPVRVDCSYLITAWSSQSSQPNEVSKDEHTMLGAVMKVLLRYATLPTDVLRGSLVGQAPPVRTVSLRPGQLQSPGDFWQALGGKPKATLNYTVTISVPIDDEVPETAPLVLSQRPVSVGGV
jgi:Pvc16 N-terminal domain